MKKNQVVMDIELYENYLLVMFVNSEGKSKYFEKYNDSKLDTAGLEAILKVAEVITFNGNNYDIPILTLALSGANNATLKQASEAIIVEGIKHWQFYKRYNLYQPKWDHVDLIEPAPAVKVSLKLYGGRLHSKRLQDLPIDPSTVIDDEQRLELISYCRNDLDTTIDLLHAIDDRLELRRKMSDEYGIDLRSKSDAQIAEAVIKQQVEKLTGHKVVKPKVVRRTFYYQKPDFIKFESEQLQNILHFFETVEFVSETNGVISMAEEPPIVTIGGTKYQLGMGGIHSLDHETFYVSDENYVIWDFDVGAYYPSIILLLGLFPDALGEEFVTVFREIVEKRLYAKKIGDKVGDAGGKIQINGTFGKLGSIFSILFGPNLMIQTTVTGQLGILMPIERLEKYGISVVSANTDGIVLKIPRKYFESRVKPIISGWEKHTGFTMEGTEYSAIYQRDINNYIAIKTDGSVKTKGIFATGGLQKSPTNEICSKALIKYLKDGTSIEETIRNCTDIRDFLSIRTVKGGAVKEGSYLGKAIRWYASTEVKGCINYKINGNKVPKTDNCRPCMILPDKLPDDIDFDRYIKETKGYLYDIGLLLRPIPIKLPRRNTHAWKAMFKSGEIVEFEGKFVHHDDLTWMT